MGIDTWGDDDDGASELVEVEVAREVVVDKLSDRSLLDALMT